MTRRIWCALALFAIIGCGGKTGPQSYPVSGTVNLDGKPMPEGIIYFKTIATGAVESFDIKNGKFEGKAVEGDRRVEINLYRAKPVSGPMGGEVNENIIPSRYNTDSKETATVTAAGPNTFTFEVKSK